MKAEREKQKGEREKVKAEREKVNLKAEREKLKETDIRVILSVKPEAFSFGLSPFTLPMA